MRAYSLKCSDLTYTTEYTLDNVIFLKMLNHCNQKNTITEKNRTTEKSFKKYFYVSLCI